jgi:hypothetical protein
MKPQNEYEDFYDRLAEVLNTAPAGAARWASNVLEMFGNEHEEQLYPEDFE